MRKSLERIVDITIAFWALWILFILATGGVTLKLGFLEITSHHLKNPLTCLIIVSALKLWLKRRTLRNGLCGRIWAALSNWYHSKREHIVQAAMLTAIFLAVFISHVGSRNITSNDSRYTIYTAMSLIEQGNTDLDEYEELFLRSDYRIEEVNGHHYEIFPIGASLVAVPFVWVREKLMAGERLADNMTLCWELEELVASFVIAAASIFIYLISHTLTGRAKYSLLMAFLFAFCTPSWSTASRALWQHGPSMLMLSITLYVILLARNKPYLIQWAGIPLAFSYVVRPTNSISVLLLTVFVLIQYRKYFLRFVFSAMSVAIPFLLFNFSIYDSFLPRYYFMQHVGHDLSPRFFEHLAGLLISPSRGLFVFSPILLLSIYGIALKIRHERFMMLDRLLLGIICMHWIVISIVTSWGGHSFGTRFFSDMIPYFIYFLIPVPAEMLEARGARKVILVSIFSCLALISFFIHYRGANESSAIEWNSTPVDVDVDPKRIWDWSDIQFLRGIT